MEIQLLYWQERTKNLRSHVHLIRKVLLLMLLLFLGDGYTVYTLWVDGHPYQSVLVAVSTAILAAGIGLALLVLAHDTYKELDSIAERVRYDKK
jgi:predicted ABC-type exoprotein transport system permease subunit